MGPKVRSIVLLTTILSIPGQGCSGSRFGGYSSGGLSKTSESANSTPSGGSGTEDDLGVDRDHAITPGAPASIEVMAAESSCLLKRADSYNFIIVFDTSSSTNHRDEANVRRAGALRFADRMAKLAALGPKPELQVSTLAFNRATYLGPSGWLKLGPVQALTSLNADIASITTDTAAGTRFNLAFTAAEGLLQQRAAAGTDKRQRNFWIFLSDGNANGTIDDKDDLVKALQPVMNSKGVAVIGIAAGDDLTTSGKEKMKAISLPTKGIVAPDHIGRYYEAPTAQSLEKAWDDLYSSITSCDSTK